MSRTFNGTSSDHLDGAATITNITGDFTLTCRVKRAVVGTGQSIYSRWASSSANRQLFFYFRSDNKLQIDIPWIAAILTGATALTNTTQWHHVGCRRVGNVWSIWIDGVKDAETTDTHTMETGSVVKVGYDTGGTAYFNGSMYDMNLWTTALSDANMLGLALWTVDPATLTTGHAHQWLFSGGGSPETDSVGSESLTVTGTTSTADPAPPLVRETQIVMEALYLPPPVYVRETQIAVEVLYLPPVNLGGFFQLMRKG